MTISKKICPQGLSNNPNRPLKVVEYITVHNTGSYGASATAVSHANYLYGGSGGRAASWHYSVDKDEIWQSFEDGRETWHAGDGNSGPGNYTSIGIEICVNDKTGFKQACENTAWLVAELLTRYKLSVDRVVQHNKWTGKNCPSELRSGAWGVTWDDFISMVKGKLKEPPTPPAPVPIPDDEPSVWAKEAWDWAKANGITDGTNPHSSATREQLAVMLYNYWKLQKK